MIRINWGGLLNFKHVNRLGSRVPHDTSDMSRDVMRWCSTRNWQFFFTLSPILCFVRYSWLQVTSTTLRTSCDLSVPWPISLVHLLYQSYLYDTIFSHAWPSPLWTYNTFSHLSCLSLSIIHPFFSVPFCSIIPRDLFYSLRFISILFSLVLSVSIFACDLTNLLVYKPLYE